MRTAVVILNWNGRALLEQFLPSVVANSKDQATVYVADNASSDDSLSFLKEHYSAAVKVIAMESNTGYAGGYNIALDSLSEDLFILLNSDVQVSENWLNPIIKAFEQESTLGAAQPKILDHAIPERFEYAGASGGFIDALGYPFCQGRIFNSIEEDRGQYNNSRQIFWASGACLCIRREAFTLAGGFDTDFFAHMEEIDLCWRIKHYGYAVQAIPESHVYHVGGGTLPAISPKKTFLNFRNSLFCIIKNVSGIKAYGLILGRLLLDGLAALRFILQGKPKHFWAILKAHLSFYSKALKMRKKGSLYRKQMPYAKVKSIVWEYFVRGKKEFTKL